MGKFYDYDKTLSFDADVTAIVSMRDRGKTYGVRVAAIKDFLKRGQTFVELCRYKENLQMMMSGYFDKVGREQFPDYVFKVEGKRGYIAPRPPDDGKKHKIDWQLLSYFVALTDAQNAKKATYDRVNKIIFDEFIIDKVNNPYGRYLPNEYNLLANLVDTVSRERADSKGKPHVILMANACDLFNPYFAVWGIDTVPPFGYTWYRDKTVILHYEDTSELADEKINETVSGRMTRGMREARVAAANEFQLPDDGLIKKKPKSARYEFGIVADGREFGVWSDWKEGFFYVNAKKLDSPDAVTYYVSRADASVDRLQAYRSEPAIRALIDVNRLSLIRYSTAGVMDAFLDVLRRFGGV